MKLSKLELKWADRRVDAHDGATSRRPGQNNWSSRRFLDFVIDGVSLYEKLWEIRNPGKNNGDPGIGPLGWAPSTDLEQPCVDRLIGEAEPDSWAGQCSVYICPECGDIGCTAITIKVEKIDNLVKCAFECPDCSKDNEPDYRPMDGIGEFYFEAAHLRDVLFNRPRRGAHESENKRP